MIKCSECSHCQQRGITPKSYIAGIRNFGRKKYWCGLAEIGTKNFIAFGEYSDDSPIDIKTSPRWCPLRKCNNQGE